MMQPPAMPHPLHLGSAGRTCTRRPRKTGQVWLNFPRYQQKYCRGAEAKNTPSMQSSTLLGVPARSAFTFSRGIFSILSTITHTGPKDASGTPNRRRTCTHPQAPGKECEARDCEMLNKMTRHRLGQAGCLSSSYACHAKLAFFPGFLAPNA
jgi:hypothetical protein